jgi:uncharacterized SAM-binding protein YcdF (DUF218 family)
VYHLGVRLRRRPLRIVAAIAVLGVVLAALLAGRHAILRAAGWMLVADDPIQPADVIVLAIDSGGAGVLEAADLVRSGISSRVALFGGPADEITREFARRGIPDESEAAREIRQLRAMGVEQVEQIADVAGTEDEGAVLPDWCDEQRLRSVVVVASADHSRRLRRVLHRAMKGRQTVVMVRRARHSDFNPEQWWRKRSGVRTEIVEMQKLVFDVVRHPVS